MLSVFPPGYRLGKAGQLGDGVVLGAPDVQAEQSVSDLPRMKPVR